MSDSEKFDRLHEAAAGVAALSFLFFWGIVGINLLIGFFIILPALLFELLRVNYDMAHVQSILDFLLSGFLVSAISLMIFTYASFIVLAVFEVGSRYRG